MMDADVRRRFEGVRKLLRSPNVGEATAAKAAWDRMVAKYGDPDAGRSAGSSAKPRFTHFADFAHDDEEFDRAAQADEARKWREERKAAMADLERGRRCGRAVEWFIGKDCQVDGIAGGPWTIHLTVIAIGFPATFKLKRHCASPQSVIDLAIVMGWTG